MTLQGTSDIVKLDILYVYPLLKIHELTETEIKEKKIPPAILSQTVLEE